MNDPSIFSDPGTLADGAAATFCAVANNAINRHGKFIVALSGGRTPKALYEILATDLRYRDSVSWKDVYFFFGDERHVLPDHPDSNFRMANEALLKRIPASEGNIFRVPAELVDANEAAHCYQQTLLAFFASNSEIEDNLPVFDLILLGMGPDGHTASLFPHTTALAETSRWVVPNFVPKFDTYRLTMTTAILNRAAHIMFLVSGDDKKPVLAEVLTGPPDSARLPSQLIQTQAGELVWLVTP
jgi:6-phosphogluconolactonase